MIRHVHAHWHIKLWALLIAVLFTTGPAFATLNYNPTGISRINAAPTDIQLSNTEITELNHSGEFVGKLSTSDSDGSDVHSYTLVTGTGSTDNKSFFIRNDSLFALEVFHFTSKSSYSIRVNSSDGTGSFEKAFTISINERIAVPGYSNSAGLDNIQVIPIDDNQLPYVGIHYPEKYYTNPEIKWPVIVQYGGDGQKLNNNDSRISQIWAIGPMEEIYRGKDLQYIIIHPLPNFSWGEDTRNATNKWVNDLIENDSRIDRKRIFTTGLSGGAPKATMSLEPEGNVPIAGAVLICPYANTGIEPWSEFKETAIWLLTNEGDNGATVNGHYEEIAAQPDRIAPVRMSIFDGSSHNSWDKVYNGVGGALYSGRDNNSPYPDAETFPGKGHMYNYFDQISRESVEDVPVEPISLSLSLNGSEVNLSWQDSATTETGMIIERKSNEYPEFTEIYNGSPSNSYVDNKVIPGFIYTYRVRYTNATGGSNWCPEKSILVPMSTVERKPTFVKLTGITSVEENTSSVFLGTLADNGYPASTYSIISPSGFSIKNGNEVYLDDLLNFEATPTLTLTVSAANTEGSVNEDFTIEVMDVPETANDANIVQLHFTHSSSGLNSTYSTPGNLFNLLKVSNSSVSSFTNESPLIAKDGSTESTLNVLVYKSSTDGFTQSNNTNTGAIAGNNSGAVPDVVLQNHMSTKNGLQGFITVTNLDPSKTYEIRTLSNGPAGDVGPEFEALITVQGSEQIQNYGQNTSEILTWSGVVPTTGGEINITVQGNASQSDAPINALIIEEEAVSINLDNYSFEEGYTGKVANIINSGIPGAIYSILGTNTGFQINNGNELWVETPFSFVDQQVISLTLSAQNGDIFKTQALTLNVNQADTGNEGNAGRIVQFHIAHSAGNPQTETGPGMYFNLVEVSNSSTTYTVESTVYEKDGTTPSSINISVPKNATEGFTYSNGTDEGTITNNNSGAVPDSVLKYFAACYNGLTGKIVITGLDISKFYNIKTLSNARSMWSGNDYTVDISVQDQSQVQNFTPVGGNTGTLMEWYYVAPDGDGTITVMVSNGDVGTIGAINALIVEEINETVTSVNRSSDGMIVNVYPLPVTDNLIVDHKFGSAYNFKVYDLSGNSLEVEQVSNTSEKLILNLSKLNAGMYIIELSNDEHIVQKKVVVTR